MKILSLFVVTFLLAFNCSCIAKDLSEQLTPINILKIFDGDTVEARVGTNKNFKVRLIGIDCYETSNIHRAYRQAYDNNLSIDEVIKRGESSKLFLENLYSKNTKAYLDFKGIDIYGRALGVLYIGNLNVNKAMLKDGGCYEYNP